MNEPFPHSNPTCDDFGLLISQKIDDEISVTEQQALMNHLTSCSSCRHRMNNLMLVNQWVGNIGVSKEFDDPSWRPIPSSISNRTEEIDAELNSVPSKLKLAATSNDENVATKRIRNWLVIASLTSAAVLAFVVVNWGSQSEPPNRPTGIVGPLVSLNEINTQRIQDQEMLLESLQLDLRTLKLQLYAMDDSSQDDVLGRIDQLMARIDQTKVVRTDIN